MRAFGGTFGAYSFYDIVDFSSDESFGQIDMWNQVLVQAISVLADLAIEMAVRFIVVALTMIVTDAIFVGAASIIYAVYEMMFVEEHKRTKYDRLVDTVELFFQRAQTECVGLRGNGFVDEQPGGSGSDAGCF